MKKNVIGYILIGIFFGSVISFYTSTYASNKVSSKVPMAYESMSIVLNIMESRQIIVDYKEKIVTSEYAVILLQRKIDSLESLKNTTSTDEGSNEAYLNALDDVINQFRDYKSAIHDNDLKRVNNLIESFKQVLEQYKLEAENVL